MPAHDLYVFLHNQVHAASRPGVQGDPHAWYPASVPFPATSLVGFDITTGGKILMAIALRNGVPPTPFAAAAAPALIP